MDRRNEMYDVYVYSREDLYLTTPLCLDRFLFLTREIERKNMQETTRWKVIKRKL